MSLPEIVIQNAVSLSWRFLRENLNYAAGYLLRQLPLERQESYRELIIDSQPAIVFGFPTVKTRIPSFAVVLQSESEAPEGQFVGDVGPSNRILPYPAVAPDDFRPREELGGITYPETQAPQLLGVDGERAGDERHRIVSHFPPSQKNLTRQRTGGSTGEEQFEIMGQTQRLFPENGQRLGSRVHGDVVSVAIIITASTAEKTLIYYRCLRWALRWFKTYLETNGVQKPEFSGLDLSPNEQLMPSGTVTVFQRTLNVSFLHYEYAFEVEGMVEEFLYAVDIATRTPDGTVETIPAFPEDEEEE